MKIIVYVTVYVRYVNLWDFAVLYFEISHPTGLLVQIYLLLFNGKFNSQDSVLVTKYIYASSGKFMLVWKTLSVINYDANGINNRSSTLKWVVPSECSMEYIL